MRKTTANRMPEQCTTCALKAHDAYICTRWRRTYAANKRKKLIPILGKFAAPDMRCPYRWQGLEETPCP